MWGLPAEPACDSSIRLTDLSQAAKSRNRSISELRGSLALILCVFRVLTSIRFPENMSPELHRESEIESFQDFEFPISRVSNEFCKLTASEYPNLVLALFPSSGLKISKNSKFPKKSQNFPKKSNFENRLSPSKNNILGSGFFPYKLRLCRIDFWYLHGKPTIL